MPILSFSKEFVKLIKSGKKRITIRPNLSHNFGAGKLLHFYKFPKTANKMFKEEICLSSDDIYIDRVPSEKEPGQTHAMIFVNNHILNIADTLKLIEADGFTGKDKEDNFLKFFEKHYIMPFRGKLIKW